MGKGSGQTERESIELGDASQGSSLLERVYLSRAAVENWAKLQDGLQEFNTARMALLEKIQTTGHLSQEPPAWMTSPKPSVDAYIFLDEEKGSAPAVLALKREPDTAQHQREFMITNCLVSRKRFRGESIPLGQNRPGEEDYQALKALSGKELVDQVWISEHCLQRFEERTGGKGGLTELQALLQEATISYPAPAWSDISNHGGIVALTAYNDDTLVFPLLRDLQERSRKPHARYTAPTCLSQQWVEKSLQRSGKALQEAVYLPRRLFAKHDDPEKLISHIQQQIADKGSLAFESPNKTIGLFLVIDQAKWLRLRPATDEQKRQHGCEWLASEWVDKIAG